MEDEDIPTPNSEEDDVVVDPMVKISQLQEEITEAQQLNAALKKKNESLQRKVIRIISQENNMDVYIILFRCN